MNDVHMLLRDGDPVAREPALGPADVERMRRLVLDAEPAPRTFWRLPFAIASTLAVMVATLTYGTTRPPATIPAATAVDLRQDSAGERRQLQFATPGGTRVIWVFDSTFEMR